MAILNILEFPDPRLRTIAKPVTVFDDALRQLIDDMFETMYEAPGIGLAATQVNVHQQVVVMDLSEDRSEPRVFINPTVEELTHDMGQYQEGCLSVPGFYENVDRPCVCGSRPRTATASHSSWNAKACWRCACSTSSTTSTASCSSTTCRSSSATGSRRNWKSSTASKPDPHLPEGLLRQAFSFASENSMRIVFAGTPEFAAEHLKALLDSPYEIVAVYTQPDRPAGRGQKLMPSPVKQLAVAHDIPVFQPPTLRNAEAQEQLAALKPDLMVVVAYGLILPQVVLDIPRLGCINSHASLLPRWRGAAPIQRAVEAGDAESGVTVMRMEAGLDTGPMLLKVVTPISADDTGGSLHDRLAAMGPPAVVQAIAGLADGSLQGEVQDDTLATYAHKLNKDEARIDWSRPAVELERLIRAFNPWPVCHSTLDGESVKVLAANLSTGKGAPARSSPPARTGWWSLAVTRH